MKIRSVLEKRLEEVTIGELGNILQRIAVDDRFEDAGRGTLLGIVLAPLSRGRSKPRTDMAGHLGLVRFLSVNDHEDPDRNSQRKQILSPVIRKRSRDASTE